MRAYLILVAITLIFAGSQAYASDFFVITDLGNTFSVGITANDGEAADAQTAEIAGTLSEGARIIRMDYYDTKIIQRGLGLKDTSDLKPYNEMVTGVTSAEIPGIRTTYTGFSYRLDYNLINDTLVWDKPKFTITSAQFPTARITIHENGTKSVIDFGSGLEHKHYLDERGYYIFDFEVPPPDTEIIIQAYTEGRNILQTNVDLINAPYHKDYGFLFYNTTYQDFSNNVRLLNGPIGGTSGNITALYKADVEFQGKYSMRSFDHCGGITGIPCTRNYNETKTYEFTFNVSLEQQTDGRYKVIGHDVNNILTELNNQSIEKLKEYAPSFINHRGTSVLSNEQIILYDPLPALKIKTLGSIDIVDWNNDSYYLEIDKTGKSAHNHITRAYMKDNYYLQFFIIDGLPPNKYYVLMGHNGLILYQSRTDSSGKIEVDIRDIPLPYRERLGKLVLYDSFTKWTDGPIRSSTHVPFFDIYNENAFPLPKSASFIPTDSIYAPSAYVKFPVPAEIVITNMTMGEVRLPYIDGTYSAGDSMYVPIIPGKNIISFEINGLSVLIQVSNVRGHTGTVILDPIQREFQYSKFSPNNFRDGQFDKFSGQIGQSTFFIAPNDGRVKVGVLASLAGEAYIKNTVKYEKIPDPPPPPPRPRDPLTMWTDIYKNGKFLSSEQLYFSAKPFASIDNTKSFNAELSNNRMQSWATAEFTYPNKDFTTNPYENIYETFTITGVEAGDFIEVYFYLKIDADGRIVEQPNKARNITSEGLATGSLEIKNGRIDISM